MTDFIETIIADWGAAGVALLLFLENLFPPLPSEVILPLAGMAAARGDLSLGAAIAAGSLGSLAGAALWYLPGRLFGQMRLKRAAARHGRWLTVSPADIDRAIRWFQRWGYLSVLLCRLVPGLRTLISIPAGLAEMRWLPFLLWSALGSLVWTSLLVLAGYWLAGGNDTLQLYVSRIGDLVLAGLICLYVWRLVSFRRSAGSGSDLAPHQDGRKPQ